MLFRSITVGLCALLMASLTAAQTFNNPVLWEDLADLDIFRQGDAYYYSASTMHYSPGAPVLRSYDLVNWEYIGHSVPTLNWGNKYSLTGGNAYIKGIWASTMRYRASNGLWYWLGCIEFSKTYVYTASSPTGPWSQKAVINSCYYDAGLLIDDNDTMYVAYGNTQISVAQLSADGSSQVKAQQVFSTPSSVGTLEGSRFYKRNGYYYIFVTKPANGQYILRSSSPFGPYTMQQVLLNMGSPISGGGVPHQGGLVSTPAGAWFYMAFVDAYPGGRVPALAPISWVNDWPQIQTVNGAWGKSYNSPLTPHPTKPRYGTDTFSGTSLSHDWEWNHNPDTSKFTVNNGLTLNTATVTGDLYAARNTLTHRILGPTSSGTIVLNYSKMVDGDRAGLAILRHQSAWVGVQNVGGSYRVSFWSGINMNKDWTTASVGSEKASASVSGGTIYLRSYVNINPGSGRTATFFYSQDGKSFTQLGSLTLDNSWEFFMGYRYAIFNHATKALGGSISVSSFTVDSPGRTTGAVDNPTTKSRRHQPY